MDKIKKQDGNIMIASLIFIAIILIIFVFILALFMSNVNGIVYGIKLDMYSINKSAILAVNKNQANVDNFTYNSNEYKKYFIELLKKNYNLDDDLKSDYGIVEKIEIKEYKIYLKNQKDNYTGERCENNTIHSVIKVKIKSLFLKEILKNIFTFEMHEDVNLDLVNV